MNFKLLEIETNCFQQGVTLNIFAEFNLAYLIYLLKMQNNFAVLVPCTLYEMHCVGM